mmetsp:Transcript_54155/g.115068  ORF Transcript_54155/g.115068 Transcript_54155/m.115068 type:complete len:269 (+) Transcript_54155:107-913(+)|eukprot:CAMPEP_0172552804 /NCGR_PEP_ID=MMETSP1067-20121228/47201_1 /TAXON_ID=265564 ORGANISM="Thalassiosira punctigera, Strain Tpunct2005C2" /NCGR_SAMPLE_ID=MMETSP1067 /ASSEMBLY_ACC=CAM_ASM_000444 /LENGTH=268 /DNA_ID=CAMNT_0013340861 /DNA_START=48 /DNA_END=854 /DNA_ORIENTATION=+
MKAQLLLPFAVMAARTSAFVVPGSLQIARSIESGQKTRLDASPPSGGLFGDDEEIALLLSEVLLFEDDEEMIPVAEAYIHSKYKQVAASHGHAVANRDDVREVLHSILPPVTPDELTREEEIILKDLLSHERNAPDAINEDDFVSSILRNNYWREAGDIVVKELMYFDCLHSYYKTGKPLLDDDSYDELHESLTWEGSSIASMNAKEVQFVSAVAASKRGEPLMDDGEYKALKTELKNEGSWVVNRKEDALEKLGLNTFMGYLHRAMP